MIFAKVSADLDSHPKVRRAGRDGREIFLFVLRRNAALDLNGRIPGIHLEPWYLADQLMMAEPDAASGLNRAIESGLLGLDGDCYVIPGWDDEWAKRPLTEGERKAKQRAKTATSDLVSGHVTKVSGHDRDCPESHALEESRGEESRVEEKRVEPAPPGKPRKGPSVPFPADWYPTAEHRALAKKRGVDVGHQAEVFRANAEANDRRCVRWNAAFTQWLLKSWPDRKNAGGLQFAIDVGNGVIP